MVVSPNGSNLADVKIGRILHRLPSRAKLAALLIGAGATGAFGVAGCSIGDSNGAGSGRAAPPAAAGGAQSKRITVNLTGPPGDLDPKPLAGYKKARLSQLAGSNDAGANAVVETYVDQVAAQWSRLRPADLEAVFPADLVPDGTPTFRAAVKGLVDIVAASQQFPWNPGSLSYVFNPRGLAAVQGQESTNLFAVGLQEVNAARAAFGARALTPGDVTSDVTKRVQQLVPRGVEVEFDR